MNFVLPRIWYVCTLYHHNSIIIWLIINENCLLCLARNEIQLPVGSNRINSGPNSGNWTRTQISKRGRASPTCIRAHIRRLQCCRQTRGNPWGGEETRLPRRRGKRSPIRQGSLSHISLGGRESFHLHMSLCGKIAPEKSEKGIGRRAFNAVGIAFRVPGGQF